MKPPAFRYFRDHLSPQHREIYDALEAALLRGDAQLTCPRIAGLSDQQCKNLFANILCYVDFDHPEFFYHARFMQEISVQPHDVTITPCYPISESKRQTCEKALEKAVTNVLRTCFPNGYANLSEYERELRIYQWIIRNVTYDRLGSNLPKKLRTYTSSDWNAYGALVSRKAACEGISKAFQLLCDRVGLACILVTGDGVLNAQGQKSLHGWNIVRVSGEFCHVDCTWCLLSGFSREIPDSAFCYFNLPDKIIAMNHIADPTFAPWLPSCTSMQHNPMLRQNLYATRIEQVEEIARKMVDQGMKRFAVLTVGFSALDVAAPISMRLDKYAKGITTYSVDPSNHCITFRIRGMRAHGKKPAAQQAATPGGTALGAGAPPKASPATPPSGANPTPAPKAPAAPKMHGSCSIIGIDLGMCCTRAAVIQDGKPVMIPMAPGSYSLPSVVGIANGSVQIGEEARQQTVLHPNLVASSFKPAIGRIVPIPMGGSTFSPQYLIALVLRKLRKEAERYLGRSVTGAVITVPGSYSDELRQMILDAAKIAGLPVERLINASSAAALAYGWKQVELQRLVVCNLGGGSFDAAVLEAGDGVVEVLSYAGSSYLGGNDFDDCIVQWLAETCQQTMRVDLLANAQAKVRLKEAAEQARIELSALDSSRILIPHIATSEGKNWTVDITLTRAKLQELTSALLDRASWLMDRAIQESGFATDEIDSVLLTGGASRMPAFQDMVRQCTGKEVAQKLCPDEYAALGAAIQAGNLCGNVTGLVLLDVTTYPLGIETQGGIFTKVLDRNTTIPASVFQEFSTAQDNQSSVDVHILQGGNEKAVDNWSLGKYTIDGIPPALKGVPRIVVEFRIDLNGMLRATAEDKGAGRKLPLDVAGALGIDADAIRQKAISAETAVP